MKSFKNKKFDIMYLKCWLVTIWNQAIIIYGIYYIIIIEFNTTDVFIYFNSIKGSFRHEYLGDRVTDEMVNYAMRMSQPAIQKVSSADSLGYLKEAHSVFFGYVGVQKGPLWVNNPIFKLIKK